MVAKKLAPLAVLVALVAVVLGVALPPDAAACNAPLDPKMELFMVSDVGLPTEGFKPPAGFKTIGGSDKPVYVIDEGDSVRFEAMWNCGSQSRIRISDSIWKDLSNLMSTERIDWWNIPTPRGFLLPLSYTAYASFMINMQQGINFRGSTYPGEPQWLFVVGNTPAGGIVKDSAFRIQGGPTSANTSWQGGVAPVYTAGPAYEPMLSDFATGSFDTGCPGDYTIRSNSGNSLANPMPKNGDTFSGPSTNGTTTWVVFNARYDDNACWALKEYGVQFNVDANATGYLDVPNNEHPMVSVNNAQGKAFVFKTPSDPLFYKVTVEVVFLFVLRTGPSVGAHYSWDEADQTSYNDAVANDPDTSDTYIPPTGMTQHCTMVVHGVRCTKVTDEAKKGVCYVRVRDVTPPKWFMVNDQQAVAPAPFTGKTGDVLAEDFTGNDQYFTITMMDNNPYAPYQIKHGAPSSAFPTTYDPSALKLRLFYTTELYDYWRGGSVDSDDMADDTGGDPLLANMHLFNLWKPKMVWCSAAVPDMNGLAPPYQGATSQTEFMMGDAGVVARTYTQNGTELSWPGQISIDPADGELITPGAVGAQDAAFSTFTWRIPKSAFKEPLPLHLAQNSSRWANGKLRFFPVMCDAAGNWNPHLPSDTHQPPKLEVADPVTAGSASGDILAAAAPPKEQALEQASALRIPAGYPQIAEADFAGDGTVDIKFAPQVDDIVTAGPSGCGVNINRFGEYGTITVVDDERPECYLFVTDQKYGKTYRFGLHKVGDGRRTAVLTAGGVWPAGTTEATSSKTRHSFDLCTPAAYLGQLSSHFEPDVVRYDQPPTTNYGDFYSAAGGQSASFAPSLQVPSSAVSGTGLQGLWVDEDTRLVFKVVAADNIDAFEPEGSADPIPASLFAEKRSGATLPSNGITDVDWEIVDTPTVTAAGGVANSEPGFEEQAYTFRNPNVDPVTGAVTGSCYAHVTVEDASALKRELYVHFFVVSNQHKFRSVEENRRRSY